MPLFPVKSALPNPEPSFPEFVQRANEIGFDRVVLVMANSETGMFCVRANCPTGEAVVLMEDITATILDDMSKENGLTLNRRLEERR